MARLVPSEKAAFERIVDILDRYARATGFAEVLRFVKPIPMHHIADSHIVDLDLDYPGITDEDVALVREFPALERLVLGKGITDRALEVVAGLTNLTELVLQQCPVTSRGVQHLASLDRLVSLNLRDTKIDDDALAVIGQFQHLESLDLGGVGDGVTDRGGVYLANCRRLAFLELDGTDVGDATARALSELRHLVFLAVWNTRLTDDGAKALANLKGIGSLSLDNTKIGDPTLAALAGLPKLERLSLSGTRVTDRGLEYINGFRRLARLSLDRTGVTDAGVAHLAGNRTLKELNICDTRVTNKGMASLATCKKLATVYAFDTGVTADGRKVLKQSFKRRTVDFGPAPKPGNRPMQESSGPELTREYFLARRASCIKGLKARALPDADPPEGWEVSFALACACGSETGQVMGYPLAALSAEYQGHEMVSPFKFRCSACGKATKIIDTRHDGHDGISGDDANYRGHGKASAFACPKCGGCDHKVVVTFEYSDNEQEMLADDPDLPVEDYFGGFRLAVRCEGCGTRTVVTELECA